MYEARLLITDIALLQFHVPWSKLDDQMYWLSEYHAAKRTEYNEALSTELRSSRSTDYHEVCTEYKVVSAEYLTIIPRVRMGYESIAHEAEGRMGY